MANRADMLDTGDSGGDYPRCLQPGWAPFDPVELARRTEKIVCRGDQRKYTEFRRARVYRGIVTGYTCGCCLRCAFCWAGPSRDWPETHGVLLSPSEAFDRLSRVAREKGLNKFRLSGAEPTIGKEHLLGLLEIFQRSPFRLFILETNGIPLGADRDLARELADLRKVHTRVSLKAGTPEAFARKTGAMVDSFELPFRAIENLQGAGASFHVASMTADARICPPPERQALLDRLSAIDPALVASLEEESVAMFPDTRRRLHRAGIACPATPLLSWRWRP